MNPLAPPFLPRWFLTLSLVIVVLLGVAGGLLLRPDPFVAITARGVSLQAKIDSALSEIGDRYPHVTIDVRGASAHAIAIEAGWEKPDAGDRFSEEIRVRVENQREATIAFLQAMARSHRSLQDFSAAEDRVLIPIWSRSQILEAGDPRRYRDFETFSAFQFSARELGGYSVIGGSLQRDGGG
jgi:hypothetical protein